MSQESKPENVNFNMTTSVEAYNFLLSVAARKSRPGMQMTIQQVIREMVEKEMAQATKA